MNVIALTGRLTADVELKQTQQGKSVCKFTTAVQRPFVKDKTDFFDVIAWGGLAEFVTKYFRKGDMIAVDGYLTQRSFETNDGNKRTVFEVIAQNCGFCGSRNDNANTNTGNQSAAAKPAAAQTAQPNEPKFENLAEDQDLPF